MKKRIIASLLVIVMSLLALCSCGAGFDLAAESSSYVDAAIDLAKILDELKKIEIKDGTFTTNEDTRAEKVNYDVYDKLTSWAISNNEKLTEGKMNLDDVLYFAYYGVYEEMEKVTVDGEEKEQVKDTWYVYGSNMNDDTINSSTTTIKNKHFVKLATVDNGSDEFMKALAKALREKIGESGEIDLTDLMYDTSSEAVDVKEGDTIVISYTRTYKTTDGEGDDAKEVTQTEKCNYYTITLDKAKYEEGSEEALLVDKILTEGTKAVVGSVITIPSGDSTTKEFTLDIAEVNYTYSDVKVNYKVAKDNGALFSFEYTGTSTDNQVRDRDIFTGEGKVNLKDKKVTYYVYPVSFVSVSDINAESIVSEVLGTSIKTTSLDVLASEEYKNGDKTAKAIVESLVKLNSADSETYKSLKDASGAKTLETLKSEYDTAAAALKAASKDAENYNDLKTANDNADKALKDAVEYNSDLIVAELLGAKNGDKAIADEIVKQYKQLRYDALEASYNTDINNKIGDAVWSIIDKNVTVTNPPAELVDELYDELYESYEYKFYTANYSEANSSTGAAAVSNYTQYNGSFEAYLIGTTKKSTIDEAYAAVREEAKAAAIPMVKIFALADAMEKNLDMKTEMGKLLDSKALTYEERESLIDNWDSATEQSIQNYRDYMSTWGENFLVDKAAMKSYKKYLGNSRYKLLISSNTQSGGIGQRNATIVQQFDRLMFYFLAMEVTYEDSGKPADTIEYKDGKIPFVNVSYTVK